MTATESLMTVLAARGLALTLMLAVGASGAVQAQDTIPTRAADVKTPAECQQVASDWRRSQPRSPAIPTLPPDQRQAALKAQMDRDAAVTAAVRTWTIECAKKFDVDHMPSTWQLIELMRLDEFIPDTIGFWRAAPRALVATDLSARVRADVLSDEFSMSLMSRNGAARWVDRAEGLLREIDALPDSLADHKLHANANIVSVYESLGLTAAAGAHAPTLILLGRRLGDRQALQLGYESMARASADRLHADSAN
jgi:hypothetical protein